jgi:hypothetical protein
MVGGSWNANGILSVKDGTVLVFEKMADGTKVNNIGNLKLGNTGSIQFSNNMSEDLENSLELTLDVIGNQGTIGSTYGRNIGYAEPSTSSFVDNVFQDLGSGKTNLQYKLELQDPTSISDVQVVFDGINKITVTGNLTDVGNPAVFNLTIKDKYMPDEIAITKPIIVN